MNAHQQGPKLSCMHTHSPFILHQVSHLAVGLAQALPHPVIGLLWQNEIVDIFQNSNLQRSHEIIA